ncbi:glycosyltransferase [Zavarzinella formosa]|uniref:glycosyltransferase n=1 Tax=Zavarzinella formosa TaxID=360055 RepID=UPI000695F0AE|nr:glycosyltransferase [Zavarzinella formosa]
MSVPLLVFADDWGRHPSSCQHLIRQLLPRHSVTWVNTIGTRTPRLDLDTVRRAAGKFRHWFHRKDGPVAEALPPGLSVAHPKMWPWLTRKIDRTLNRKLLLQQLNPVVRAMPDLPVAITTLPVVADLMGPLPVRRWIYYCVDDFSQWPGLDRKTMGRLEETVVAKAERIVAVSENLRTRLRAMGRDSDLLTHGVDTEIWANTGELLPEIAGLERPLIVFWGVVDRRMDTAWVRELSRDLTCGTIVLAGPNQDPDPVLKTLPRVKILGPLAFRQLPTLAREAAVLVMPYADQPVTRAMQPLKLKEYLATGKPAVARDLPANLEWADALDLVASPAAFSALVRRRLETGLPAEQMAARTRLNSESWAAKARRFADLLQLDDA